MLDKREVPEIAIWEHFLVFATAFGIADKVLKQLKIVYPNIENDLNLNTYTCIYFMMNTNFSSSFSNAISTSMSSAYTSASGGGGGFSGGGGGGRWPEVGEEVDKPSRYNSHLLLMLHLNQVVEIIGIYIMQQKVEDKFLYVLKEMVGIKKKENQLRV